MYDRIIATSFYETFVGVFVVIEMKMKWNWICENKVCW